MQQRARWFERGAGGRAREWLRGDVARTRVVNCTSTDGNYFVLVLCVEGSGRKTNCAIGYQGGVRIRRR